MLTTIIEGQVAAELYITSIDRNLVSRPDYAAYLGRELARAEHSLATGQHYVQDTAPEHEGSTRCGSFTGMSVQWFL